MSNRSGSNNSTPRDANRVPLLAAASTADGVTPVYLEADPTTHALSTSATLSASSLALNDGVTTTRKATVANLTNANPLAVEVVDGSGNQITSFGGGTQYTTGSAQATPTGTVSLGWDGTDVKALPLDGSGFLKVNVAAGGGSGGTSSSFSSAFPATGTAIGATDGTNMQPLKVDGSDNLLVNLNTALPAGTNVIGHTITDSGSVTAASQSGTWNITNVSGTVSLPTGAATSANQTTANSSLSSIDGKLVTEKTDDYDTGAGTDTVQTLGIALPANGGHVVGGTGTNPFRTDPTGTTTQPVSAASLPLPTGAATAAKQPAIGTAGTASADVITVQGIASMIALKVDGTGGTFPVSGTVTANAGTNLNTSLLALESGGNLASIKTDVDNLSLAQGSTTSGQKGNLILGAVTTSAPTYTTAQSNPLSLTTGGALRVDASATTQPVSGTVTANAGTGTFNIQSNASMNLAQVAGASTATGHGTASGSLRVELPTDGTGVVGLNAGSNLVGKVGIDQTTNGTTNAVVTVPATSGGLSMYSGSVGATATSVKASAGQLYGYHLFNTTAAVAYVQIFNVASGSVTLGTTTPDLSIGIPASGGVTVNFDKGIAFSTAISFACTTTRTGSSGATCDVNFFYK